MAIISCPECSKDISDKALSCPNCGNPIKANQNKTTKWLISKPALKRAFSVDDLPTSINIALTFALSVVALFVVYGIGSAIWERTHPKQDPPTTEMQQSLDKLDRGVKNPK
jgi:uncharacterized membrane protein YvbJ